MSPWDCLRTRPRAAVGIAARWAAAAMAQGPPGTGKSFVGSRIAEAITRFRNLSDGPGGAFPLGVRGEGPTKHHPVSR